MQSIIRLQLPAPCPPQGAASVAEKNCSRLFHSEFPIRFPSIRRFFYGARVKNRPAAMRKCFSTVILPKRCTREKCETVSHFSKWLSINVLRTQKRVFSKNGKPYRKFFRGKDLCLNRGCEDKKVDVRIEDLAPGSAGACPAEAPVLHSFSQGGLAKEYPAGRSCPHLCPSVFIRG